MQKIVFVGIILVIGLFSLQYAMSSLYADQFTGPKEELNKIALMPVNYVEQDCKVVYVYPNDSIVRVKALEDCQSL